MALEYESDQPFGLNIGGDANCVKKTAGSSSFEASNTGDDYADVEIACGSR